MPQTRDVGRVFFHLLKYPIPGAPLIDRSTTNEVEPPYREGRGRAVRIGRRWAIVVGRWHNTDRDEDQALLVALRGQSMDVEVEEVAAW